MARMIQPRRKTALTMRTNRAMAIAAVFLASSFVCDASRGQEIVLPSSGATAKIAMRLTFPETSRVGSWPVKVFVRSVGPSFPAERTLTIEVMPRSNPTSHNTFDFRQDVVIPQGRSAFETTLEIPVYYPWDQVRVRVLEDGLALPGFDNLGQWTARDNLQRELKLGVIEARSKDSRPPPWARFPDCRTIHAVFGLDNTEFQSFSVPRLSHTDAISFNAARTKSELTVQAWHEDRLPTSWKKYLGTDVILASQPTLLRIAEESPDQFKAIREWISTGGVLWTYGTDSPSLLDAPLRTKGPWPLPDTEELKQAREKRFASADSRLSQVISSRYNSILLELRQKLQRNQSILRGDMGDMQGAVRTKEYLLGKVIHLDSEDPFPGTMGFWLTMYGLSSKNLRMENRLGTNITRGDKDFWDWLINEVGQPPVYTFLGMISVFVLLVGPISYQVFLRVKRLYLFFAFAPVMAMVCSAAIGIYAFVADGFGTRVRIRNITIMNDAGDGVRWSRQTYFAGLRPRDGVAWNNDCAVFPMRERQPPGGSRPILEQIEPIDARVTAEDDVTRFDGQFIPSRTQSQFVTFQPLRNLGSVKAVFAGGGGQVTNDLPYHLTTILLADQTNGYWRADEVSSGRQVMLEQVSLVEAAKWLREFYLENAPAQPPGYQDASRGGLLSIGNRRRLRRVPDDFFSENDGGLAEAQLRATTIDSARLTPSSFIAVAELPEDSVAVEGALPIECIHIMLGPVTTEGSPPPPISDRDATPENTKEGDAS